MDILLEEFYKTDLQLEKFHDRKQYIDTRSYQIIGVSQCGKTRLVKEYLLSKRKSSYLYINCNDVRIAVEALNNSLAAFCNRNKIEILVLDNYKEEIKFPNVSQLIITGELAFRDNNLQKIELYPLDYEEFLAYEHKYDSSALNHFFQLGGLPMMHKVSADEKAIYIQRTLQGALSDVEFDIITLSAKYISQKLSPFTIYERLKLTRKISKDTLYRSFEILKEKKYIHLLEKFEHKRATKKVYLCDIAYKSALSIEKDFGRLFENMIFLELLKSKTEVYYDDAVDFYLPQNDEIILAKPFADERRLYKKLESIEAFIFTHSIKKVTAISMNKEGILSHPFAKVEILPFDIWALGDKS